MPFRFIHLSDFHLTEHQPHDYAQAADAFFNDLRNQLPETVDLAVLSGDFVDRADWSIPAKERITNFITQLALSLPNACFVVVPGNHDLDRKKALAAHRLLIEHWDSDNQLRTQSFHDPKCPLKEFANIAFGSFVTWWDNIDVRKPSIQKGLLPGDFAATIRSENHRIGVLGLNSAFLCLGERATGEVTIDQWNALGGPDWCDKHDICILVTHHPIDSSDRRTRFQQYFLTPGYFSLHLFGDLHDAQHGQVIRYRGVPWHSWQCASLFAEHKPDVGFGYAIGELDLPQSQLRIYPRRRLQGQFFADPDICADGETMTEYPISMKARHAQLAELESIPECPRPFEILISFDAMSETPQSAVAQQALVRCRQAVNGGNHQDALATMIEFAHEFYFVQNAFVECYDVLQSLVHAEISQEPSRLAWCYDALGNFTGRLGRPIEAIGYYDAAVETLARSSCPAKHHAIVLGNRFLELVRTGQLEKARTDEDTRIPILLESADDDQDSAFQLATAYIGSAYYWIMKAELDKADEDLGRARHWFERSCRSNTSFLPLLQAIVAIDRVVGQKDFGGIESAVALARSALKRASDETMRDQIRARWAMGVALGLKGKSLNDDDVVVEARTNLRRAHKDCQRLDLKEIEADILLARAYFDVDRHCDHAQEALTVARACDYKLKQVDAHIALARIMRPSAPDEATIQLAKAQTIAERCGYTRGVRNIESCIAGNLSESPAEG